MTNFCPACGAEKVIIFYTKKNIPVHSVRLLWRRDQALAFQNGQMDLAYCQNCGFIFNASYRPELQDYSAEYESTQAFSPTFNSFAGRLAHHLVERYNLRRKKIIEIGCGQGEFLSLLCKVGENEGTGFDPAYDPSRSPITTSDRVEIIPDYYSEKYAGYQADFVCCKMTLEHIRDVADFVGMVRRSIGDQRNTTVFFQVPDVDRILQEIAFWDIYYEHCSYFTMESLARLFHSQGFEVNGLWRDYGDQYLMIDARPGEIPLQRDMRTDPEDDSAGKVAAFATQAPIAVDNWKKTVQDAFNQGEKIVLWGSGSKGVAFLTTLEICNEISYTVDINPNKHGTYMAGTGQKVVSPDFLSAYRPDLVILMNPMYRQEVQAELLERGLDARIISVGR